MPTITSCAERPHATKNARTLLHYDGGEQHLLSARAPGTGVIVVTGHLGHWELGGLMLARLGLPLTVVTLEEPSSELTRWREACRRQLGIKTITVGPGHPFAFVEMMQTLRRNELIAMLVDRPYAGTGACVDLFGRKTEFSTAPALLAHHTGARVLPAFVLHDGQGGYRTMAEAPVAMETNGDLQATIAGNTQRIASVFESVIRRHPEQWFNYVPRSVRGKWQAEADDHRSFFFLIVFFFFFEPASNPKQKKIKSKNKIAGHPLLDI